MNITPYIFEDHHIYSAEDADTEGEEGKFYLWSMDEIISALGKENALIYAEKFQFQKKGNYLDETSHELTGKNIPHLSAETTVLTEVDPRDEKFILHIKIPKKTLKIIVMLDMI